MSLLPLQFDHESGEQCVEAMLGTWQLAQQLREILAALVVPSDDEADAAQADADAVIDGLLGLAALSEHLDRRLTAWLPAADSCSDASAMPLSASALTGLLR